MKSKLTENQRFLLASIQRLENEPPGGVVPVELLKLFVSKQQRRILWTLEKRNLITNEKGQISLTKNGVDLLKETNPAG